MQVYFETRRGKRIPATIPAARAVRTGGGMNTQARVRSTFLEPLYSPDHPGVPQ